MLGIRVMQMKKIKLIAIIGKAGSGKNTMLHRLMDIPKIFDPKSDIEEVVRLYNELTQSMNKRFNFIVPFTTRPQRQGEIDGIDYYFYEERTIKEMIRTEKVFQYRIFNNWYYGFFKKDFVPHKINVGIFTPSALMDLVINYGDMLDITTIYITAPDKDRLLRQLNREEKPDVHEIVRRFTTDDKDFDEDTIQLLPNLIRINNPNAKNDDALYNALDDFLEVINTVVNSD